MTHVAKFWDKIAPKYATDPIKDMDGYTAGLDRIRGYLKPDDAVLELGCGTGMTAGLLAANTGRYLATDVSQGMIDQCGQRGDMPAQVSFAVGTACDATTGDYDAVLALNVLHLFDDLADDLTHIHRALKGGGVFISKTVVQPRGVLRIKFRLMMAAARVYQWLNPGLTVRIGSAADLQRQITAAGFAVAENTPMGDRQFIVARKP